MTNTEKKASITLGVDELYYIYEIADALRPLGVTVVSHQIEQCFDGHTIPTIDIHGIITRKGATDKQVNPYIPSRILASRDGITTLVFWQDGTKTIVKRAVDEEYSPYAALTAALAIKVFGSNSAVKRIVKGTETQEPKKKRQKVKEPEQKV